jgi:16S rRNA (adenine1518-N6/adenine1519-N6)-dimethyltransferase
VTGGARRSSFRDARTVLREEGLVAKKSFGQNFLVAESVAQRIAEACVPDAEIGRARVVEIGAGLGALTALLLARAAHVVAIERDRDLCPVLARAFADAVERGTLTILEADAQTVDIRALLGPHPPTPQGGARVLAGNLPYQLTGRLLQRAVEQKDALERAVFMVQAEVCDRLLAAPSTKDYGALTVFTRAAFTPRRVLSVSAGSFHPAPDVASAVVELVPRPAPTAETPTFRALVRAAFMARRKTLRNAWSSVAPAADVARAAAAAGVSLDARGETLDVEAFAKVALALGPVADPRG